MTMQTKKLRAGVKYCGHCQPRRDMTELMQLVRAEAPDVEFVRWSDPGYSVLLLLQACDVACAEPPSLTVPLVEVIVSGIDFVEYQTDSDLARAITACVRKAGNCT